VPRPARSGGGGLLSRPAALGAELERSFPERPFAVRFWDGTEAAAAAPGPTFLVNSAAVVEDWRPPQLAPRRRLGLAGGAVRAMASFEERFEEAVE
jgi:hypothetical protein